MCEPGDGGLYVHALHHELRDRRLRPPEIVQEHILEVVDLVGHLPLSLLAREPHARPPRSLVRGGARPFNSMSGGIPPSGPIPHRRSCPPCLTPSICGAEPIAPCRCRWGCGRFGQGTGGTGRHTFGARIYPPLSHAEVPRS